MRRDVPQKVRVQFAPGFKLRVKSSQVDSRHSGAHSIGFRIVVYESRIDLSLERLDNFDIS